MSAASSTFPCPYPNEEAVLYAILRVGHLKSENPLGRGKADIHASSVLGTPCASNPRLCMHRFFTPRVEAVHVIPDADGHHAVFAMTLLGSDIAERAATKDASGFVMGEWALTRRPRDGLLELNLVRRFVAPQTLSSASVVDDADDGHAALDVPTEDLTLQQFLRLAATLNPTWLRSLYEGISLDAVRTEAEAALGGLAHMATASNSC